MRAAGPGIVFGKRERHRVGLRFPVFEGAAQIPRPGFQICFRIEQLLNTEIVDLIFVRPFIGRFLAHLHEAALSGAAVFFGIKAAFAPNDCFHQHRIEMMFHRHQTNQVIVFFKTGRAHPFVERVDGVARSRRQITKARSQCEQYAKDQFKAEPCHLAHQILCSCSREQLD